MNRISAGCARGEADGFFYDIFHGADGSRVPLKVSSMVGLLPLTTTVVLGPEVWDSVGTLRKRFEQFLERVDPKTLVGRGHIIPHDDGRLLVLGVVPPGEGRRVLKRLFDENEFLSPYGLRSLSRHHADHPLWVDVAGAVVSVDYEPAGSTTGMFGGNSNWRGPVWMPVNYLLLRSLRRNARSIGEAVSIEYPTGSGNHATLGECADDLRRRLISLFVPGPDGRRPCYGSVETLQHDPRWRDNVLFFEYFHGENGAGLGACTKRAGRDSSPISSAARTRSPPTRAAGTSDGAAYRLRPRRLRLSR